ncbi:hypothetical protein [Bradyrhizobium sp. WSM1417]|uniref:hypothetical protein n=1 Tax=Bradyrhizobium sp. WSM1417 TaxID=754500 RepID=UPI000482FFF3|nr:hypothetical protein [Bradyrhizobium sp. WSM1417]
MPPEVARYWLHEHWGYSSFFWLPSRLYRFDKVSWAAETLGKILSDDDDFRDEHVKTLNRGKWLVEGKEMGPYRTARYMLEHRTFPFPIVVLDNRNGGVNGLHARSREFPKAYMLVEGHRRFSMALFLARTGRISPTVPVWLMTKIPAGEAGIFSTSGGSGVGGLGRMMQSKIHLAVEALPQARAYFDLVFVGSRPST